MTFITKCASEQLHEEWQCSSTDKLVHGKQVLTSMKNKLLELVGKTEERHYSKSPPRFCESCVAKVQELYPEQCASEQMHAEWHCTSTDKLVPGNHIQPAIKYKLLELVGKTEETHYSERLPPKFCKSCIAKAKEIYPERCASEQMHDQWHCTSTDKLVQGKHIRPVVRYKLLELVGKTEETHYSECLHKFCKSCIAKAQEINPERCASEKMHEEWLCTSTEDLVHRSHVPSTIRYK